VDIRVAAYGVIVRDGRVLLAHWNQDGRSGWTLPGGGLEPGEDPADAARREIWEETGFVAELHEVLGVDSIVIAAEDRLSGAGALHGLRVVYRATVTGGALRNELDGSTDEAAWFALDEVTELDRVELVDIAVGWWAATRHEDSSHNSTREE
jgi:ADP-ribose pyrophosphatase YjhB (NUDIX family)